MRGVNKVQRHHTAGATLLAVTGELSVDTPYGVLCSRRGKSDGMNRAGPGVYDRSAWFSGPRKKRTQKLDLSAATDGVFFGLPWRRALSC